MTKGVSKCSTCVLPWSPLVDWLWDLGLWTQGSRGSLGGEGVEGFRGGRGLVRAVVAGQPENGGRGRGTRARLLETSITLSDS